MVMVCWAIVTMGGGMETGAIDTAAIDTGVTVAMLTGTVATLAVTTLLNVPAATAALTICCAVGACDGGTVFVIVTAGTVTAVMFAVRLPDIRSWAFWSSRNSFVAVKSLTFNRKTKDVRTRFKLSLISDKIGDFG